jgi:general secretion pathway protein H
MKRRITATRWDRGVTLLEVMVALAIIAAASVAVMSWNRPHGGAFEVLVFSRQLQSELRKAKASAIGENRDIVVTFDGKTRAFQFDTLIVPAPSKLDIQVTAADAERRNENVIGIRFFPSGRTSGGTIELRQTTGGAVLETISVHWLTGKIESRKDPQT